MGIKIRTVPVALHSADLAMAPTNVSKIISTCSHVVQAPFYAVAVTVFDTTSFERHENVKQAPPLFNYMHDRVIMSIYN